MKTAAYLKNAFFRRRSEMGQVVAVAVMASLLNLISPWPLQVLVDNVLGHRPLFGQVLSQTQGLVWLGMISAFYLALVSLRGYLNYRRYEWLVGLSEKLHSSLSERLFSHLIHLPLSFFDKIQSGDLTSRVLSDTQKMKESFVEAGTILTSEALTLLGTLVILWQVDRIYTALMIVILFPLFILFAKYPERIRKSALQVGEQEGKRAGFVQERIQAIREVKAFCQEQRESQSFTQHLEDTAIKAVSCAKEEGQFIFWVEVASGFGMACVLGYGGYRVNSASLSLGEFLVFVQYLMLLHVPVGRLSRLLAVIQKALASQSRLDPVFLEAIEPTSVQKMKEKLGEICFENVTFEYRAGEPILRQLNLTLQPGEKIAILGATGAGKSSLINILAYGYPLKEGRVLVQGRSLDSFSPGQIRSGVSLVSQDPTLFSGTLLENIRYACPEASLSEVKEAVRLSHLNEFIARLPKGYETQVGEHGVTLSGGEKQRLAIARAVLKKSSIWILDEPTSAVDAESEEKILRALETAMQGKTVLLITHRTAPLRLMDRIFFLEGGKLRENPVWPAFTEPVSRLSLPTSPTTE